MLESPNQVWHRPGKPASASSCEFKSRLQRFDIMKLVSACLLGVNCNYKGSSKPRKKTNRRI